MSDEADSDPFSRPDWKEELRTKAAVGTAKTVQGAGDAWGWIRKTSSRLAAATKVRWGLFVVWVQERRLEWKIRADQRRLERMDFIVRDDIPEPPSFSPQPTETIVLDTSVEPALDIPEPVLPDPTEASEPEGQVVELPSTDDGFLLIRSLDVAFSLGMFMLGITVLGLGFNWADSLNHLDAYTRLVHWTLLEAYAGTIVPVEIRGLIIGSLIIAASLSSSTGRHGRRVVTLLGFAFGLSVFLRVYPSFFFGWTAGDYLPMLIDVVTMMIGLSVSLLPGTLHGVFSPPESAFSARRGEPELLPLESINLDAGDDVPVGFELERPRAPSRRQRGSFSLYEGLFLMLSLILWPITIACHVIVAAEISTRLGTWTLETDGIKILAPLYLGSLICSIIVLRLDREARAGEIYAKEKAAYHADMDHYLTLKAAYWERKSAEVNNFPAGEE